jgi:hypothetical protein
MAQMQRLRNPTIRQHLQWPAMVATLLSAWLVPRIKGKPSAGVLDLPGQQ